MTPQRLATAIGLILIFLNFFACNPVSVREGGHPKTPDNKNNAQQAEQRVEMLLDSLNAKIDEGDTTGFAALYESALVTLDSLQLSGSMSPGIYPYYRSHLDSLWEEYQSFTHDQKDSSEIADVFHRIDQIADSLEEADTTEVLIPDIINQHHMMRIPLVLNRQVESAIKYFTTTRRGRRVFSVWLKRAGRYEKLIRSILREEGVPEELFYLAMIESGLNPNARSYARAVGIWQFIGSTGRAYGLRYSWWYDERRDPVKSTRAAARHLKDLYDRFGDWYLALAGYNFSPRKIEYRLRRYKVSRYWDLPRLPRQTRNYVPTFIAAAIIAKNPEKYGFNVTPDPPLEFDTVMVRETVDLNIVAQCVSSTFSTIKELNPELLRWCTPPDRKEWVLKIPKGTREQFLTEYAKIPDNKKFTYIRHRIRFGETLSTIARRYGVSMSVIKRFNKLRGTRIRAGSSLIIPVPQNRDYYRYVRKNSTRRRTRKIVKNVPGRKKVVYTVKPGDTLWDIAQQFGVTLRQIRYWNGLGYSRIIRPGQKLNIWLPEDSFANQQRTVNTEQPPQTGASASEISSGEFIYHTVKPGDTLWDIAQRYGVSIREIKKWNGRRSNLIRPGDQLKILRKSFHNEGTQ